MRRFSMTPRGCAETDKRWTLLELVGETDFTDEEFEEIAALRPGEATNIGDGEIRVRCEP